MKIKVKRLGDIVSQLRYDSSISDNIADVELVTADPGNGIMADYLKITAHYVVAATTYSPEKHVTHTIEVFGDEGVKPRVVKTESYDLKD